LQRLEGGAGDRPQGDSYPLSGKERKGGFISEEGKKGRKKTRVKEKEKERIDISYAGKKGEKRESSLKTYC